MEIITGSKRQVAIKLWREQLEKYIKRANDSMKCFTLYNEADDLTHLIEDCEQIISTAKHAKEVIEICDKKGIE